VLSPLHAAWRETLAGAGLLGAVAQDAAYEWIEVPKVGSVFRERGGPALLVSPMELSPEMQRIMPALIAVDTRTWLSQLELPVLVMCGGADPIVPLAHARALHEAIAGSEFVEISAGGHVPTAERHPEVAAAVRRFLAELQ
jgi:pimeloyl-ACP methyl ester carboxylesterase